MNVEQLTATELAALLRAAADRLDAAPHVDDRPDTIRVGRLIVDRRTRTLTSPEGSTAPPPKHYAILAALAAQPGQVLSPAELWREAWPGRAAYDPHRDAHAVRVAVCRARHAIPAGSAVEVRNRHAHGWMMEAVPDAR